MLALMRNPQVSLELRLEAAVLAAPFVHMRPQPMPKKRPDAVDTQDQGGEAGELKYGKLEPKPDTAGTSGPDAGLSPLDFLLGLMADPAATPQQRLKAAAVAARYRHAVPVAEPEATPTLIVVEDKFGFKVDPELARAERDDMRAERALHGNWYRRKEGSDEDKAAKEELAQIRKRRAERLALLKYPQGYTAEERQADRKRLEQLGKIERKKLTPREDAEEAHLTARIIAYELKPELLAKKRIRELEERRAVGFDLTAAEQRELRDLRERYPEVAAEIDRLDLKYIYHFRREFNAALKAGLNIPAAAGRAQEICRHLRDPSKFEDEFRAQMDAFLPRRSAVGAR